jgi:hypothetical protein
MDCPSGISPYICITNKHNMTNTRTKLLIGSGILNAVHGSTHVIQLIQSLFMIGHSQGCGGDGWMHSPWMGLVWGIVGLGTLCIGIYDYYHHKKCKS